MKLLAFFKIVTLRTLVLMVSAIFLWVALGFLQAGWWGFCIGIFIPSILAMAVGVLSFLCFVICFFMSLTPSSWWWRRKQARTREDSLKLVG